MELPAPPKLVWFRANVAKDIIKDARAGVGWVKYTTIIWDLDDDPDGNVQHIAQHGLSKEEVEEVLENPAGVAVSRSSGRPIAFGETTTGRLIAVIYEEIDPDTARLVTAYDVEEEN